MVDVVAAYDVETAVWDLPAIDEITLDDKEAIEAARKAYEALSDAQTPKVPQSALDRLADAEETIAIISAVNDSIEALPEESSVKTSDKEAIEAARKAYEALNNAQKAAISESTVRKLEAAESAYKVEDVKALIDNIGTVEHNEASKAKIETAKAAYDALTPEEQARVTNANVLTAAEQAYDSGNGGNSGNGSNSGNGGNEPAKRNVPVVTVVVLSIICLALLATICYVLFLIVKEGKAGKPGKDE